MKFALAASLAAATVMGHPIEKVIDQMVDLRIKAKEEGEAEALAYQKFSHWCTTTTEEYQGKIAKNNEEISSLESAIDGYTASIAALTAEIDTLTAEIKKRTSDQATADELRAEEKAIYDQKKSDLEETIKAIVEATDALKGSKSVLQVRAIVKRAAVAAVSKMSAVQSRQVHAFLQETETEEEQQPEEIVEDPTKARVRKYDFKSGSVIELLEQLSDEFKAELLETEKAETNGINGHELATQAQDAAIKAAKASRGEKKKILADTEQAKADAEANLASEKADLEANQSTLSETQATCAQRANEFEERSTTREGEQAALSEAVAILSKVTGLRNPLEQKIAKKEAPQFLQTSVSVTPAQRQAKAKAVALINAAAAKSKDAMVARLAQQVKVAKGPFKQIKNMIQKMIFHLNKEQQDEDAHKNWCDTELETTSQQRDEKADFVEETQAKVDSLVAKIAGLTQALEEENQNIADTQQYVKEETELRAEHKADNLQTQQDAKEAQAALAQAIAVLTDFYKGSGSIKKESWEFAQVSTSQEQPAPEPATWDTADASFTNTGGSGAVMKLLEEVLGDYSKMEAEATATEESEDAAFDEDMKQQKIELARLRNEVKVKTARKTTLEEELAATQSQLKKGEKQLDALKQYLKDLQQPCVSSDSTYEDRKSARASEIEGLKQALNVLADAFKPKEKSFLAVREY